MCDHHYTMTCSCLRNYEVDYYPDCKFARALYCVIRALLSFILAILLQIVAIHEGI
ncbi:hypothetical protein BVRB_6g134370 [Beta vulgaris subsp. vulgaris]|nr:hypothetical protein BVRB_6g134370 [Beta vulgaris subsp. vulgaris]